MKILLPRPVVTLWKDELRRAGRREIGGVLMGEAVAQDTFRIVEASVQRGGGTATSFVRDPRHHGEAIRAFHRRTGHDYTQFNYLGEWHSHPSFPTTPSRDDLAAMHELLADGRIGATFACLLIVRLRLFRRLDVGAYVFTPDGGMQLVTVVRER
ncbi:proteasome lid subunit RPN8/RPN11 [Methylobacterium sp. BE186]|uniref:Mov34/MPN/PAD-1 family protein n=1 Tax=Methylobacterium sp. BE186 TaxID=2817715 RepID=UPI00286760B9|nr:Mov34/MPN/PAD-1 family protein [Methylobacterium sp. BE186]MDR7038806.1 proteasome lid subunit RPN8/RPN11 [Methylobacterium sp. BE186]